MSIVSRLPEPSWRMIRAMERDLSDDFKLSFRSIGEVNEAFAGIVARAASDPTIRYRGRRKSNRAAVLNALILWLDSKPPQEQRAIVGEGMRRLNALLGAAGHEDVEDDQESDGAANPSRKVISEEPPPSTPRRKRQG